MIPLRQSVLSSRYSRTMETISAMTPIPTAIPQYQPTLSQNSETPSREVIELSNAEMELFRADMEASKVEASVAGVEDRLANVCIITAIVLVFLMLVASGVTIALRSRL